MSSEEKDQLRLFKESLANSNIYPKNLLFNRPYEHVLDRYVELLQQADRDDVFYDDPQDARVVVRELEQGATAFQNYSLSNIETTKEHFTKSIEKEYPDPKSRFTFIKAPSSRDPLDITREMLTYILTYEQAMPSFLDFIVTFGDSIGPKDQYFSGLRHESQLSKGATKSEVPKFQRQGRTVQLCYNLKSPECSCKDERKWWSVRQTAVYQSYDFDTGRTSCILVKANDIEGENLMEGRIKAESEPGRALDPNSHLDIPDSFGACLNLHLLICDWARENWRWYLKFLEEDAQSLQERTKFTPVRPITRESRVSTGGSNDLSVRPLTRELTDKIFKRNCVHKFRQIIFPRPERIPDVEAAQPTYEMAEIQVIDPEPFSPKDLQQLYSQEERANEASTVLKANVIVIQMLRELYRDHLQANQLAEGAEGQYSAHIRRFVSSIDQTLGDLSIQQGRLDTLLKEIVNTRSLLTGLLELHGANVARDIAEKSQWSAQYTQKLTEDMHHMTKFTGKSTTSMKAITVATLLFLPPTFISTFLSTDVVRIKHAGTPIEYRSVSAAGLKLYFEASLPLLAITILFWFCTYKFSNYKEEHDEPIHKNKLKASFEGGIGTDT